jgi:hypothetical protein
MSETIREFWAVIAGGIAALAWLFRLESRGFSNSADIRRLWSQRKEDMEAARESRDKTDKRLDEIGADIKSLLRRERGSHD